MSNRHALSRRIQRLGDIGAIMTAMKNLAFMETRKLERQLQVQQLMVAQIKQSAQLCISHFPEALPRGKPEDPPGQPLWLLIGSERGFCGDFNQRLVQQIDAQRSQRGSQRLVTLGYRLNQRALSGVETLARLPGANACEETEPVLIALTQALSELQQQHGPFPLSVLFNLPGASQLCRQQLLPPFQDLSQTAPQGSAPLINMAPEKLLLGLGEHYLFVRLQHILNLSLMAENQLRIIHLQGAIKKLEQRLVDLQRKMTRLRQEAIVEEIEIILINQSTLTPP